MKPSEAIKNDGIYLFKNVFNAEEINKLRRQTIDAFSKVPRVSKYNPAKYISNCNATQPELDWVVLNSKLLDCVRQSLGTDDIMYTSILGLQENMLSDWHKDDGTRNDDPGYFERDPLGDDDCMVLKIAIYLQKHDAKFPGFYYRLGSHKHRSLHAGEYKTLDINPGDIAIFDARLTHSGVFATQMYKYLERNLPSSTHKYLRLCSSIVRQAQIKATGKNKHGVFIGFGVNNQETVCYSKNMMINQIKQYGGDPFLSQNLVDEFSKKGVSCASTLFDAKDFAQVKPGFNLL